MRSSYFGVSARTRDRKAGIELPRTLQLIHASDIELALAAHTGYPFDANKITLLPYISHIVGYCHQDASSFVARNAHCALLHLAASACTFIVEEASIEPTVTIVFDPAKNLAGSSVWDMIVMTSHPAEWPSPVLTPAFDEYGDA